MQRGLDATGPWLAVGLALAAAGIFLVRLALPDGDWLVAPLLAGGCALPLLALPRALGVRDAAWHLAGELDRRCSAQGLAMAASAGQAPGWEGALAPFLARVPLAGLAWRAWRGLPLVLVCLLVSLAIPQLHSRPPALAVGTAFVAPVAARAQALKDQGLAPEPEAERLAAEGARLEAAVAREGLDALRWEALDRLAKATEAAGEMAARRLAEAIAAATDQAALAAGAGQDQALAAAADLAAALDALGQAAPGLARLDPASAKALAQAAAAAAQAGKLDRALAQRLAQVSPTMDGRPGKPCDAAQLARLAREVESQLSARRAQLARLALDGTCQARLAMLQGVASPGRPGSGGPGGGGPSAPLTRVERGAAPVGEAQGLPPAAAVDPDGSVTFATTVREPEPGEVAAAARAAARAFDPAVADARRAAVAPRHRAAVASYFAAVPAPAPSAKELPP